MDPVQFALMEDNRPQARIDANTQENAQNFQQVMQGADLFQRGRLATAQLAQTKQLTMAQMAQNQTQFNALQALREQEFQVNSQKSMADIAQLHAVTENDITQNQLLQQQAQLQPKIQANQAAITNILSQPQAKDPATGSQWVQSQLSSVPFPEALTDLDRKDALSTADLGVAQSAQGIAFKTNLTQQLNVLGEAATIGLPIQNYVINKQGDPNNPTTYNMSQLASDVMTQKVRMQQNLIQTQGQTRIDVAKIQAGARTDTGKTILGDLSRQAIEADKAATAITNKFPPASASDIATARATAAAAHARYEAAASGATDEEGSPALATPGQTGQNMQNPSGTNAAPANPAQSFWINNMGGSANGQ